MRTNQTTLFVLIALFAAAAFLLQSNEKKYTADEGRLVIMEDAARDALILSWSHEVGAPMTRRFEEAYKDYGRDVSKFVIELNSPGGAVAEGKRMVQLLERMARSHEVETRVDENAFCLSMCVPIYLKGETRSAAPSSRWMFHEPASYDAYTGERGGGPEIERRFVADRFFDRYFENSEMDPEWRSWLEREWVGKDVWKTGEELVEEGSGVITRLE